AARDGMALSQAAGERVRIGVGDAVRIELDLPEEIERLLPDRLVVLPAVRLRGLMESVLHAHDRVERALRGLEGHRALAPAEGAELLVRDRQQVDLAPVGVGVHDPALCDSGFEWESIEAVE